MLAHEQPRYPVTRLTTVDSAAGEGHTWPHVLPGGKAVLFNYYREARTSNEMDVLVVRVADTSGLAAFRNQR